MKNKDFARILSAIAGRCNKAIHTSLLKIDGIDAPGYEVDSVKRELSELLSKLDAPVEPRDAP